METRRLRFLLELSRRESMRAVADHLQTSTSNVSQQIASLARECGTALIEPAGRRVKLTPAGRRLAAHAATILDAVDAAHAELDPSAQPSGTVRVAGFATAIRRALLPIVADLAVTHPAVRIVVVEQEPAEALALLADDDCDLALTYDYTLAPAATDASFSATLLWSTPWTLGVPDDDRQPHTVTPEPRDAPSVFAAYRNHEWIGNSRNRADEHVIRVIASLAGFEPNLTHQCDGLDLVEDLILAGMGVGLLPADRPPRPGVTPLQLIDPDVRLRAYALTRRGPAVWPPLALLVDHLTTSVFPGAVPGRPFEVRSPRAPAGSDIGVSGPDS